MRAIDAVLGQPWAIEPAWLSLIAAIAQRQFDSPSVAGMQENRPRAAERGVSVRNGVAVIGMVGPIFPRANMMTENSGATSIDRMRADFRAALTDPDVKSILFNIDSPGGAVTGTAEFAAEVMAARKKKPIVSYVGGDMCSGAYWIGSAASRIVVDPTARVGSIGVATAYSKQVEPDTAGELTVDIVSSNAPDKRPDPTQEHGKATIVATLDAIEAEFIANVAKHRGVSEETVRSDFGRGGLKVGREAVEAGMADDVGTFDSVLTALAAAGSVKSPGTRVAAATKSETPKMDKDNPTVADMEAAHPDLVQKIRNEAGDVGYETGAKHERERILGIEAAALPGHEDLVAKFKADGKTTPGEAALAINAAHKATLGAQLKGIKSVEDVTSVVQPAPNASLTEKQVKKDAPTTIEGWKAEYAASPDLQAEYGSADEYANYQLGIKEGRVKIFQPGAKRA